MAAEHTDTRFPSPWNEFLHELDGMLTEQLELHCIGGFVFTHFFGLPRSTGDIDCYAAVPANLRPLLSHLRKLSLFGNRRRALSTYLGPVFFDFCLTYLQTRDGSPFPAIGLTDCTLLCFFGYTKI
jgi:hypothetical protein